MVRVGQASRGPVEATYAIEPDGDNKGLALVRYSRGWHDGFRTRHVLVSNLQGWDVRSGSAPRSAVPPKDAPPTTAPSLANELLIVTLHRQEQDIGVNFWSDATVVFK